MRDWRLYWTECGETFEATISAETQDEAIKNGTKEHMINIEDALPWCNKFSCVCDEDCRFCPEDDSWQH